MLGGSLFRFLSRSNDIEVLGTVRTKIASNALKSQGFDKLREGVDVSKFESVENVIKDFNPDYVINCVGVIKQLEDSKSPIKAIEINSLLPHKLAQAAKNSNARLIHFSTDCVFSGNKGRYEETDVPDATDLYGRSKLLGEVDYDGHLTLRTSIIGHELGKSVSLIDWFLNQIGTVKGYRKAVFSGMPTVYVAEFLRDFVFGKDLQGLFHLSVAPIDKYSLLNLVRNSYDIQTEIIPYDDFEIDRSLNSEKLRSATGFVSPAWDELVKKMRDEYLEYFH
jgi:dTDP-4-dehydrorhamnose reductase